MEWMFLFIRDKKKFWSTTLMKIDYSVCVFNMDENQNSLIKQYLCVVLML